MSTEFKESQCVEPVKNIAGDTAQRKPDTSDEVTCNWQSIGDLAARMVRRQVR